MEKVERVPGDFTLILIIVLLVGVGLSVLFSSSYFHAEKLTGNPYYFFRRQVLRVIIGIVLGFIASRTPSTTLQRYTAWFLIISLILTILTFVPGIGTPIQGSRRWIFIFGNSFEPSELAKFSIVLYLASIFSKKREKINDAINTLLPPFIVVSIFVALIYLQNDFSTAFFILFIAFLMFYVAEVRLLYFFLFAVVVIPLGLLLLFTKEHRVMRLITFLNPRVDPSGSGYQILTAQNALVNGGLFGRGLGQGVAKLGRIPEAHSDFIFAAAGEEIGLVGVLFIMIIFIIFAWRGYIITFRSGSSFNFYLAFGITSLIFGQTLLNMSVVAGLVPATGIPLPFFSAGGSSIVMTLLMSGVLIGLSREASHKGRVAYG